MKNPFISYAERSYLTIKQAIIDTIKNPVIGIPEITDYSEANEFIKTISIWSGISEQLGYYLNKKARERFLITCRKYESMVHHARSHDYRIHGVYASVGNVTFTLDVPAPSGITIPAGTKLKTTQDIEFLTLSEVVIPVNETEVNADVKQFTFVPEFVWGTSDGSLNIEVELETTVVDKSMSVKVAGNQIFTAVDTFAYSKVEDRVYVPGLNTVKNMVVKFGDDITGEIPQSAADIAISYYTSLGYAGNVPQNTITEIVSAITLPPAVNISVNNKANTNGGADVESLEELRVNIPLSIRTKMRAVTDQDFIDIAQLAPGVAKADVSYNSTTGVTSYVVPVGGGIASDALLAQVDLFFEDKRAIQTIVNAKSVGEVRLQLVAVINVLTGYNQTDTVNLVKQNLLDFLSWEVADIKGSLSIGDIYQVMEETDGVLNSQINNTGLIPYPSPDQPSQVALNWTIEVIEAEAAIQTYSIQFIDATNYNLFKNNNFIDSYVVGNEVDTGLIKFTVLTGTYNTNDSYTFKTYPTPNLNIGLIKLDEFSQIISRSEDLTITGVGGII